MIRRRNRWSDRPPTSCRGEGIALRHHALHEEALLQAMRIVSDIIIRRRRPRYRRAAWEAIWLTPCRVKRRALFKDGSKSIWWKWRSEANIVPPLQWENLSTEAAARETSYNERYYDHFGSTLARWGVTHKIIKRMATGKTGVSVKWRQELEHRKSSIWKSSSHV